MVRISSFDISKKFAPDSCSLLVLESLPTSKLRIPIQVGAGDIGIYYLKEPVSAVGEGSSVECWVDDNYGGAKVIENAADVGEPTPSYVFLPLSLPILSY
jgi:hypothetical protein